MMHGRLMRHRIRGVTFHRQRSSSHASGSSRFFSTRRPPQLDEKSLQEAHPTALSRDEIYRLAFAGSPHEIHALVLECIDQVGHWRQLSHAFDNYIFMRRPEDNTAEALLSEVVRVDHDSFLAVEARTIYLAWRHRLDMLELIAQAQKSNIYRKV